MSKKLGQRKVGGHLQGAHSSQLTAHSSQLTAQRVRGRGSTQGGHVNERARFVERQVSESCYSASHCSLIHSAAISCFLFFYRTRGMLAAVVILHTDDG